MPLAEVALFGQLNGITPRMVVGYYLDDGAAGIHQIPS
jgi:hypothetical protein